MPQEVDLTTLTDLKNYISPSLGSTTASDATLTKIITAVSLGINRYCSRRIAFGNITEFRNGNGRRAMRTLVYPILSVASVTQGESAVETNTSTQVLVEGETPAGLLNGENQVFTLAYLPTPGQPFQFFYNGLLQALGVDYSLVGSTITFLFFAPESDATLTAFYSYTQDETVMALPPGTQTLATTNDQWFIYASNNSLFGLASGCFEYGRQNVALNYLAGYITPGQLQIVALPAWSAGSTVLANYQIQNAGFYYQAINAGTLGATKPAFQQVRNSFTVDNGVVWRCQGAVAMPPPNADMVPEDFQEACMQQAALLFKNRTRVGDTSSGVGPDRVNYFLKDAHPSTLMLLKPHREVFPTDGLGVV